MNVLNAGRTWVRRSGVIAIAIGALVLLAACGGGSDSDDEAATEATVRPAAPTFTPVSEPEPTGTPAETATPEPTNTPEPSPTATPSPTPVPPTPTPTITPTPSPTPLPTVESPFGESLAVVDIIPNFTLSYSANFQGAGGESEQVDLLIEQANPESYHLRVASAGQQTEAWRVENTIYVSGPGGAIVELPGLVDPNLYAPSSFLFLVPDLQPVGVATVIDEDAEIGGRSATHYRLDPAVAGAFRPFDDRVGEDVDGTFDVWVDNQLGVIVRISADVTWRDNGGPQSMQMEFLISEIDTTPEVQPPL